MSARPLAGLGVDSSGGPVIDPTENVKALSEASHRRQDDLREAQNRYLDARLDHIEATAILRAEHTAAMRVVEQKLADVRDSHAKEIRELETARVNAVRLIDTGASAAAAAESRAQTLANTTIANQTAEALRSRVDTTAQQIAKQLADFMDSNNKRVALLEQALAMGQGRQTVADPASDRLAVAVERLERAQGQAVGKSAGSTAMWGYVAAGIGLVVMLIAALGGVVALVVRFAK